MCVDIMFSCKSSPSWYFIGVQCNKCILTLLIAKFKNATQKETSDVLNNGRISCELCHIILLKKIRGIASIYFLHYIGVFVLVFPLSFYYSIILMASLAFSFPVNTSPFTNNTRDG